MVKPAGISRVRSSSGVTSGARNKPEKLEHLLLGNGAVFQTLRARNVHVRPDARAFHKSFDLDKDHRISVVRKPLQSEI